MDGTEGFIEYTQWGGMRCQTGRLTHTGLHCNRKAKATPPACPNKPGTGSAYCPDCLAAARQRVAALRDHTPTPVRVYREGA